LKPNSESISESGRWEAQKRAEAESRNDLEKLIASWTELKNQQAFIDELTP